MYSNISPAHSLNASAAALAAIADACGIYL
jgi:hypothetical protein